MRDIALALIIAFTAGGYAMADNGSKPLVEYVEGKKPRIEILASEKREKPVSRYLHGKFSEHLWHNVYNGMWAQILRNTGFEPAKYFRVAESQANTSIALKWNSYGEGDASYSLSPDRINSDTSQKIEVRSLQTPEVGILQNIYLPLHRTDEYELSIWAKGSPEKLHVAVRTNDGMELGGASIALTEDWKQHAARFRVSGEGIEKGQELVFSIGVSEPGTVYLDQCFLFPSDHMKGFDPDVVRLLKESRLPLLRFPGGNFASGYHWKDGIGPVDDRPIRPNPAWEHDEPNHVGVDEMMAFCEMVGCEPLICVNAGDGTPEEAADWVEYCNGDVSTKWGAIRAKNGHPAPYNVKLWEIGNELYGDWQIGHCTPEEYADRYRAFREAMLARDPDILLIANGQDQNWNPPIIRKDADILRSLSTHCLLGHPVSPDTPAERVFLAFMALTAWHEDHYRHLAKQMVDGGMKEPRLALTELQIFTNKWNLPNNQTLTEALFYSGMVNTAIRLDGLVELITHSALVNHGGGLCKHREVVFANPVHWANHLYATQSGRWPVRLRITSPWFATERLADIPGKSDVSYLDAVGLLDDSGKELNVIVTNRHPRESFTTQVMLDGFAARTGVKVHTIGADSYMATNSLEKPDNVRIVESFASSREDGLTHTFPAHSITLLVFRRR